MSDPLWINAAADVAVGAATIESADNLFTVVAHTLVSGDRVVVSNLTGGAVGVLAENGVYWVRDVGTDVFALSLTKDGIQINFATDGTADVDRFQPAYTAEELRRGDALLLLNGTIDAFGARQGVRPGHTPVTLAGTTWTVEDLTGVVYPAHASNDGPYRVQHESESASLNAADGDDRIDALDLQVQDHDEDSSGQRRARVVYTPGTPAVDPDPPPATSSSLRLATILVPAGGTPSPSIVTLALFTVASGGVLPIRDSTERPVNGLYDGLVLFNQTTGKFEVRLSGTWVTVPPVRIPTVTASKTSDTSIGGSETTVVSAPSITGDGVTKVKVTIKWYGVHNDGDPVQSFLQMRINRGATTLDQAVLNVNATSAHFGGSISVIDTPPVGAQTYSFTANPLTASAANVVDAASNALASIRVEQVFD